MPRFLPRILLTLASVLIGGGIVSCGRSPYEPELASRYAPDEARFATEVMVTLTHDAKATDLARDYGANVARSYYYFAVLTPPRGEHPVLFAARLRRDPRVVTAERNEAIEPAETRQESFSFDDGLGSARSYEEQPAAQSLGLVEAHRRATGDGITVAVLDTGIDPTHPLFQGRIAGGFDYIDDDQDFTDRVDGLDQDADGRVDEAWGHGTHVAGLVTLAAPGARLLVVRVLDADGRGDLMSVACGIAWAMYHGADVVNLSLGALRSSDAIQAVLARAEGRGIACVASAGNWGAETPREYPAASPHAEAIGASSAAGRPAEFTSYGRHLLMLAPGQGIRSAYPGGEWRLWSGTSMSAPFVSGAIALLRSRHPDWPLDAVRARLCATALPLVDVSPSQIGKVGAGMLNVAGALQAEPLLEPGAAHGPVSEPADRLRP